MAVELHRLLVLLLRIGEKVALHILTGRRFHHCLGGDALVDVEGDRIYLEKLPVVLLLLLGPLQPGLLTVQGVVEQFELLLTENALDLLLQFENAVGLAGRVET